MIHSVLHLVLQMKKWKNMPDMSHQHHSFFMPPLEKPPNFRRCRSWPMVKYGFFFLDEKRKKNVKIWNVILPGLEPTT